MQRGFFDIDSRLIDISDMNDPLERLDQVIDWSIFDDMLDSVQPECSPKGGRPSISRRLLFKMLVIQRYYNISDFQVEYQVKDRLSFMRFPGLEWADKVPDEKTLWAFREDLKVHHLDERLFERFHACLSGLGVQLNSGQIIDATFVSVPGQRNNRDENQQIKDGEGASLWLDKPHKRSQKDTDARWTKKNHEKHYGYKNHINVDRKTKLITKAKQTAASVHDSQEERAIRRCAAYGGADLWKDSAYPGREAEAELAAEGISSHVIERSYRNKPLSEEQKLSNREKSRIRVRVEHVFATMENEMGGISIRSIGLARARVNITLMNLTYNLKRVVSLVKMGALGIDRITTPEKRIMA